MLSDNPTELVIPKHKMSRQLPSKHLLNNQTSFRGSTTLYLFHQNENVAVLLVSEPLVGINNFVSWKKAIEIAPGIQIKIEFCKMGRNNSAFSIQRNWNYSHSFQRHHSCLEGVTQPLWRVSEAKNLRLKK